MNEQIKDKTNTKEDGKLIRVTKNADQITQELLNRVNENVDNARITKGALVSFMIEQFAPKFSDDDINTLYMQSVSEVVLLRNALKQATENGAMPDNLRNILFANAGLTPGSKRVKKSRRDNSINDTIQDKDIA